MTKDEQLAALRARLAQIDAAIQQLTAARDNSGNAQERANLAAQIAGLEASRDTIQQAINNLDTGGDVSALGFAATRRMAAIHREHVAAAKRNAVIAKKAAAQTLQLTKTGAKKKAPTKKKRPAKKAGRRGPVRMVEPTSSKTGKIKPGSRS